MDAAKEYRQVHEEAALFDASSRAKIELAGPDVAGFLHNLSTNDIRSLALEAGCEIFLTNAKAKVIAFACVYHLPGQNQPDTFWLDLDPAAGESAIQHLNKFLISEQVEIFDRTKDFAQFFLLGPKSRQILTKVLGPGLEEWKKWHCGYLTGPDAIPCQVRFHHRLDIDCFELIFPFAGSSSLWNQLAAAGALPISPDTLEILRVEAGLPVYGIDIDENVLAPEVGRSAISYNKGCYLGQETIVRIRDLGHVNRMLRGLKVVEGKELPRGSKVSRDGKEVGVVTSSVTSPRQGGAIALAYLNRACQEPGTRVEVTVGAQRVNAEVSSFPFGHSGNT